MTRRSWEATRNTCPFNVTGHPAISIPCGMEDGLPIGLMLVGRHWDESTIYRAANGVREIRRLADDVGDSGSAHPPPCGSVWGHPIAITPTPTLARLRCARRGSRLPSPQGEGKSRRVQRVPPLSTHAASFFFDCAVWRGGRSGRLRISRAVARPAGSRTRDMNCWPQRWWASSRRWPRPSWGRPNIAVRGLPSNVCLQGAG